MLRSIFSIALLSLFLLGCSSGPDAAAKQLMENLREGKHLAVSETLSKELKQAATLFGGVSDRALKPYYRTGQIQDYSLQEIEKTENARRFLVTVTTISGKSFEDRIDVVKQDGDWKIARF